MACGTASRCDAALRPRGRARVARARRTWRFTRGRRPRGCPGGTPRGIGAFAYGGPTGIVGHGKKLGAVTQMRYRAPIFKRDIPWFFLRVGLCSHTSYLCRTRGSSMTVGSKCKASIAWIRVHAIINHSTCLKYRLSEAIYTLPFATWKHQERPIFVAAKAARSPSDGTEGNARWTLQIFRSNHHRDLLPSDGGHSSQSWSTRSRDRDHPITRTPIGRRGGFVEELHDRGPIETRSRRDRATIVALPSRNQHHDLGARFQFKMAREMSKIKARLPVNHDQDQERSWPQLKRNQGQISAGLRPRRCRMETASTMLENRLHECINPRPRPDQTAGILEQIFSLKSDVFSL